jgi:hypothetical protein
MNEFKQKKTNLDEVRDFNTGNLREGNNIGDTRGHD